MPPLHLICEYRGRGGTIQTLPLQVQAELQVGQVVEKLRHTLHAPQRDRRGRALSYRLRLPGASSPLPADRTLSSLSFVSGTHLRLEVRRVAPAPAAASPQRERAVSRRALFAPLGSLLAVALAGLVSGSAAAFVQRRLAQGTGAASAPRTPSPSASPVVQAGDAPTMFTLTRTFQFSGHHGVVRSLTFSPDGMLLASGGEDRQLLLWTKTGIIERSLTFGGIVHTLAWEPPPGARIVAGSGTALTFLATATGEILARRAVGHTATITGVVWLADAGRAVVSCGLDKRAVVWETGGYQPRSVFTRHTSGVEAITASLSGGASTIATVSQGGVIRVWDPIALQERHGFYQSAQIALNAVAFSHQGTLLAAGAADGLIHLWSDGLHCGQQEAQTGDLQCMDSPQRVLAHQGAVRALAFSPDDRLLVSGGDDGQVILWDTRGGRLVQVMTQRFQAAIHTVAFSPDGTLLAVATGQLVELWQVQSAVSP